MALTATILSALSAALGRMGNVTSETRLRAKEIVEALAAHGTTLKYVWGYDPNEGNTEHHAGLAIDIMVFGDKAAGDWVYSYVWSNRARLRVKHIVWQQSITSTVTNPGVRRPMEDRGNSTKNHMDHVHVLFLDNKTYVKPGVTVKKIVVKKKVAAKPLPLLRDGSKGASVSALQRGLNQIRVLLNRKLVVDGKFGPATEAAVKAFQTRVGFKGGNVDGVVGPATRAKLRTFGIVC